MTTPEAAAPGPSPRRAWLMAALVLATAMGSLDASFVPLTFRDIIVRLDTSTSVVVWVALGYLIAATGPMLFMARVGDRHGHGLLFRIGSVVYAAAMSACAFAPDIRTLIALRVVQGLGMAMFLPATFALATSAYPPRERGRPLGILASANAVGFIVGPLFAGFLLDAYDWRATFLTRIPLGLVAVVLAFLAVPWRKGTAPAHASLDPLGAALLTASFFGILYGTNRLPVEDNHRDPLVWAVFLAGLALLVVFARHERKSPEPIVDLELFRQNPRFTRASLAFTLLFATFPAYLFVLPIVLLAGFEMRAWDAGLLLGSVALVTFLVSPYAGKASDKLGAERLCALGALFTLAGYLAMLLYRPDSGALVLLFPMLLMGIGNGLFFSPNNNIIISSAPPARAGMAAGLIGTMRQTGYALGFAVAASLFTFIQDAYEGIWVRHGLLSLPPDTARALSALLEGGGVWSPEMLVLVFRCSAVLSAALMLLTVLYSLPRFVWRARGHLLAWSAAVVVAVAGMLAFAGRLRLPLPERSWASTTARAPVAPFGMASRAARPIRAIGGAFQLYCAACHGADGKGRADGGLDLTRSELVRKLSDEELAEFLRKGRAPGTPGNRTGRVMPGMESFATFTEQDYAEVIRHLRVLSGSRKSG